MYDEVVHKTCCFDLDLFLTILQGHNKFKMFPYCTMNGGHFVDTIPPLTFIFFPVGFVHTPQMPRRLQLSSHRTAEIAYVDSHQCGTRIHGDIRWKISYPSFQKCLDPLILGRGPPGSHVHPPRVAPKWYQNDRIDVLFRNRMFPSK